DSRESYKDALWNLADGDDVARSPRTAVPKMEQSQPSVASGEGAREASSSGADSHGDSVVTVPVVQQQGAVQRVSIGSTSQSQVLPVPGVAVTPSSCSDAYCKQLYRIAEGAALQSNIRVYEPGRTPTTEATFLKNLAFDQLHIWTSPFRMHDSDATWAIPFGIVTGSLIATDRDISKQLDNAGRIDTSKQISNLG